MEPGLSLRQSLELELRQSLRFVQTISLAKTLEIPPSALDEVLNSMVQNPEETERILGGLNQRDCLGGRGVKALFSKFSKSGEVASERRGLVCNVNLTPLSELVADEELQLTPDVFYIGRENRKPEIYFAEFFRPKMRLKLGQIPSEFERTRGLFNLLLRQRDWILGTLRRMYVEIGGSQREFIEDLCPSSLNYLDIKTLSKKVGVGESTISRLRRGKYVMINPIEGDRRILPVSYLMPNQNDIRQIDASIRINAVLEDEAFRSKDCPYSDEEIAEECGERVARRTVTKYRRRAGIPNSKARERIYKENPDAVFQIEYPL